MGILQGIATCAVLLTAVGGTALPSRGMRRWPAVVQRAPVPRGQVAPTPTAAATIELDDEWFRGALAARPAAGGDAVSGLRGDAEAVLPAVRRPTRKDEAWRRTDLSSLFASPLAVPAGAGGEALLAGVVEDRSEGMRLVLVDGTMDDALTDLSALPAGARVCSLGSLDGAVADGALAALRTLPETGADKRSELGAYTFAALNQAAMSDVMCVHLPAGLVLERPLHVYYLSTASADGVGTAASHPNLLVKLEEGAGMSLEQHYTGGPAKYFTNALTRLELAPGATLTHSHLQEQGERAVHIETVMADVGAGAKYEVQAAQVGSLVGRLNMGVRLGGSGASTVVQGITLAGGTQLLDTHS